MDAGAGWLRCGAASLGPTPRHHGTPSCDSQEYLWTLPQSSGRQADPPKRFHSVLPVAVVRAAGAGRVPLVPAAWRAGVRSGVSSMLTQDVLSCSRQQLKQQRDKLKQYQKRITQQLEREREIARQLLRDGRKE